MLGDAELAVLASLHAGDTISDIATDLDYSESYVSRTVVDLEQKGLVLTERDGRRKRVEPSHARAVERYRDLVREYPHVDFGALLTETTIEVLYHFDEPSTVGELAERSDNYRNTVHRILERLRNRGLVGRDGSVYRFNGDFDRLHEFATDLRHHLHRQRLEAVAPDGTLLWKCYDEFLAQTESVIDAPNFFRTGLARFADYGLQFLLPDRRYYFYSDRVESLSPADVCCHALLIDDGPRRRSYCLLLLATVSVDDAELRTTARRYELEEPMVAMAQYLETEGEKRDETLPTWSAFEDLARDYEVQL